jgi:hypothetical protein
MTTVANAISRRRYLLDAADVIVHGLVVVVAVDKVEIPGSNRSVTRWGIDKGIQI